MAMFDEAMLVVAVAEAEPPKRLSRRPRKSDTAKVYGVSEVAVEQETAPMMTTADLDFGLMVEQREVRPASRARPPPVIGARSRASSVATPKTKEQIEDLQRRNAEKARIRRELQRRKRFEEAAKAGIVITRRRTTKFGSDRRQSLSSLVGYREIIENANIRDTAVRTAALTLANCPDIVEAVIGSGVRAIHIAARIILHVSHSIGRAYDPTMIAYVLGTTPHNVKKSLGFTFEKLVGQAAFSEADFIPTYLWITGVLDHSVGTNSVQNVKSAIDLVQSRDKRERSRSNPSVRSVYSIARDYVTLFIFEVLHVAGYVTVSHVYYQDELSIRSDRLIEPSAEVDPVFVAAFKRSHRSASNVSRDLRSAIPQVLGGDEERGDGTIGGLFYDERYDIPVIPGMIMNRALSSRLTETIIDDSQSNRTSSDAGSDNSDKEQE